MNGGLWNINNLDREIIADILRILESEHTRLLHYAQSQGDKKSMHYASKESSKVSRAIGWISRL